MDAVVVAEEVPLLLEQARTVFSCKTDGGADGGAEGGDIGGRRVVAGRRHDVDTFPSEQCPPLQSSREPTKNVK
jgi:hypothetical protein